MSSLFPFVICKARKSFALRPCMVVIIVVATTMYKYIYIYFFFFHFNCCSDDVYRYATLCCCCCRSLSFFFSFSIRLTLAIVSALHTPSLSLLPSYSVTIHFTRVLYIDVCHMYFFFSEEL
jgi:hypothetical protein